MDLQFDIFTKEEVQQVKKECIELGITLQEYLEIRKLQVLGDIAEKLELLNPERD